MAGAGGNEAFLSAFQDKKAGRQWKLHLPAGYRLCGCPGSGFLALDGVPELVEEGFALVVVFLTGVRVKLPERLLLFGVKVGGNLNGHLYVLISPAPGVDVLDTLVAQPEDGSGLGALGDVVFYLAVNGGDGDLVASTA